MPRTNLFAKQKLQSQGSGQGSGELPSISPREDAVKSPMLVPPRSQKRLSSGGAVAVSPVLSIGRSPRPAAPQGTSAEMRAKGRAATVSNAAAVAAALAAVKQLKEPKRDSLSVADCQGDGRSRTGTSGSVSAAPSRGASRAASRARRPSGSGSAASSDTEDDDDRSAAVAVRSSVVSPNPTAPPRTSFGGSFGGRAMGPKTSDGDRRQSNPRETLRFDRKSQGQQILQSRPHGSVTIADRSGGGGRDSRASTQTRIESDTIFSGFLDELKNDKFDPNPGRTSQDIDSELEQVLAVMGSAATRDGPVRRHNKAKTMTAEQPKERTENVESYTERVVRYQDNKAMMQNAVETQYGRKNSDVAADNIEKTREKDVDDSVLRVRAKLQALKATRQDFLDGAIWDKDAPKSVKVVDVGIDDGSGEAMRPARSQTRRKTMV